MAQRLKETQASLFPDTIEQIHRDTSTTFIDNLSLPIHRWFRYSAGFSALWVREFLLQQKLSGRNRVLDPFAGSGTVLIESELANYEAMGIEAHPLVSRIAQAKLYWNANVETFRQYAFTVMDTATKQSGIITQYPEFIRRSFSVASLEKLNTLHRAWLSLSEEKSFTELCWLALVSTVRQCLSAKSTQQYVFPNKNKVNSSDPYKIFENTIQLMSTDMLSRQMKGRGPIPTLIRGDARDCTSVPDQWADLVITSPPYANNYDYADATRLEMSFFGYINNWGDLQDAARKHLVRACTQHVGKLVGETYEILNDPLLVVIKQEIVDVCKALEVERESHGGKKNYHTMIAMYFYDMAKVWVSLRRATKPGALVCFIIGDSAPYGIYTPVDKWLGELAVSAGFKSYAFEKMRDRNVKWKNRKHRVPLHEGRLWVEG